MITIKLSPQRRDDALVVAKTGTTLTINGDELDLSEIPDGATYNDAHELHPFLTGNIVRSGDDYELTMILPHGPNPGLWQAWPDPIVDPADGTLDLPSNTFVEEVQEVMEPDGDYEYGAIRFTSIKHQWHLEDETSSYIIGNAPPPAEEPAPEETEE